jgi:hypothetical protein
MTSSTSDRRPVHVARALWLVAVACLLQACAKAPHEELQAAEKTVREAETVGAPIYLPEEFSMVLAKLETAKEEIEAQYKESEFNRDYSRANTLLTEARAKGDQLIAEAQKRREEAKAAALQEKEQASQAVDGVRQLVERVEGTPGQPAEDVSDHLAAEAHELSRRLAEVQTAIEANNHLVAKEKAKAIQQQTAKLKHEVTSEVRSKAGQ